jgi:hypothetical protein
MRCVQWNTQTNQSTSEVVLWDIDRAQRSSGLEHLSVSGNVAKLVAHEADFMQGVQCGSRLSVLFEYGHQNRAHRERGHRSISA